jgi:hypothetical protein
LCVQNIWRWVGGPNPPLRALSICWRWCLQVPSILCAPWLASKNDTATGSFCTHLLGELDCRGKETPQAQNWCCLYRPRRGVSHTRIGYAWVMLTISFACLTSDWLTCLSSDWLTCLSSDWLTFLSSDWLIFKTSSWQKNFTAYICVVASVSQRHPATSNVASHNSISYVMLSNVSVFGISNM